MSDLPENRPAAAMPPTEVAPNTGQRPTARSRGRAVLWGLLHWATLSLAGAALAGYCGRLGWLFELASHFRVQYGVLLAASSLCYAFGRRWRVALAAGILSVANLCLVISVGSPPPKPDDRTVVRALLCNVQASNQHYERLLELVRTEHPDLIVLIEVDFDWQEALRALDDLYPYRRVAPATRGWGMAFFSRIPLDDLEQTMIGGSDGDAGGGARTALAMVARLRIDGHPLTVIGTHPCSPVSPSRLYFRNRQLADLARLVGRQHGPVVLLGDLNVSPWSPYFQDLLSASGLRDSRQGFGIQASWPTSFAFARIPIDHCLVSSEIAVHDRRIGPKMGSDHFPVVVDFSIWPEPAE